MKTILKKIKSWQEERGRRSFMVVYNTSADNRLPGYGRIFITTYCGNYLDHDLTIASIAERNEEFNFINPKTIITNIIEFNKRDYDFFTKNFEIIT